MGGHHRPLNQELDPLGFHFQMSFQVTLRSIACSHFIQMPCCRMATALLVGSSLTEVFTSSCTRSASPFIWQSHIGSPLRLPSPALPCATVPMMALCFSRVPLLAGLPRLPSNSSLSSQQSLHGHFGISGSRVLQVFPCPCNDELSLTELKGSMSLLVILYSRCYIRLRGRPSICVDSCSPFSQNLILQSPHR